MTTAPSIAVQMTWNSTNTGTTVFDIAHSTPFTVQSLTAPTSVPVSGVTYYFNHWEVDGTALGSSNVVTSISVGGSQSNSRAATAYYLPTSPLSSTISPSLRSVHRIPSTILETLILTIIRPFSGSGLSQLTRNNRFTDKPQLGKSSDGSTSGHGQLGSCGWTISKQSCWLLCIHRINAWIPVLNSSHGVSYAQIILGNSVLAQMQTSPDWNRERTCLWSMSSKTATGLCL